MHRIAVVRIFPQGAPGHRSLSVPTCGDDTSGRSPRITRSTGDLPRRSPPSQSSEWPTRRSYRVPGGGRIQSPAASRRSPPLAVWRQPPGTQSAKLIAFPANRPPSRRRRRHPSLRPIARPRPRLRNRRYGRTTDRARRTANRTPPTVRRNHCARGEHPASPTALRTCVADRAGLIRWRVAARRASSCRCRGSQRQR